MLQCYQLEVDTNYKTCRSLWKRLDVSLWWYIKSIVSSSQLLLFCSLVSFKMGCNIICSQHVQCKQIKLQDWNNEYYVSLTKMFILSGIQSTNIRSLEYPLILCYFYIRSNKNDCKWVNVIVGSDRTFSWNWITWVFVD